MKGKPSKVALRRLHETPAEFAAAQKAQQGYGYQRWQTRCERAAERDHARVMPAKRPPMTAEERQKKDGASGKYRYY